MAFLALSEPIQVAALTAVSTFAGVAITQVVHYFQSRSERQARLEERRIESDSETRRSQAENVEWYKRTLFERHVQAVNDAYVWVMRINVLLNGLSSTEKHDQVAAELRQVSKDAREWYDHNVIFFYEGIPGSSEFVGLTNAAASAASGDRSDVWQHFNESLP